MDETSKQIVIAVAAASAAALASGLISHYLTKSSIASGATPLPAGSTPTTTSGVIVATPKTSADQTAQSPGTTAADASAAATPAPPPPAPQITPQQLQNAIFVAKAASVPTYSYNAPSVPQSAWTPKNVNP